jgi:hypothetical protein
VHFPLYVYLLVVGREFIVLLFTRQYAGSWPVLAVYLTVMPLGVIVLDPITRAFAGQRYFLLKLRLVLFALMTLWFGISRLGLLGAISLVVAMQIAGTVGAGWRLSQVMGLRRADYGAFAPLAGIGVAAVAAGGVAIFVRHALAGWSPFSIVTIAGAAYGLSYAVALMRSDVVDAEDVAIRAIFGWRQPPRPAESTVLAEVGER